MSLSAKNLLTFFGDKIFPKANFCEKQIADLKSNFSKRKFISIFFYAPLFPALFGQELLKLEKLHFISLILTFHGHEVKRFTGFKTIIHSN